MYNSHMNFSVGIADKSWTVTMRTPEKLWKVEEEMNSYIIQVPGLSETRWIGFSKKATA